LHAQVQHDSACRQAKPMLQCKDLFHPFLHHACVLACLPSFFSFSPLCNFDLFVSSYILLLIMQEIYKAALYNFSLKFDQKSAGRVRFSLIPGFCKERIAFLVQIPVCVHFFLFLSLNKIRAKSR
jgi:hypothetical protein